jgi:hypothetical protein
VFLTALIRPALRRARALAYLDVSVRQHLVEVAHVDVGPADRAIAEMIGLGFGNNRNFQRVTFRGNAIRRAT